MEDNLLGEKGEKRKKITAEGLEPRLSGYIHREAVFCGCPWHSGYGG